MRALARAAIGLAMLGIVLFAAYRTTSEDASPNRVETTRSDVLAPAPRARPSAPRTRTSTVIEDPAPPPVAAPIVETGRAPPATDAAADREATLRAEVSRTVFRVMDRVIDDAVRNAPAFNPATATGAPGTAQPGTLAAAKQWCSRELQSAIWEKVRTELQATDVELDKCWKSRDKSQTHRASYGNGSFVVMRRAKSVADARRPSVGRPTTDEEWWIRADIGERTAWLTANFVEGSGYFEILATPEESCANCDGAGRLHDGVICPRCNGCGGVRSVNYR